MTKLIRGVNDLATTHPSLILEWHPTKNGDLKPTDVTAGSKKNVWWYLAYDDSTTGKHFDFEWEAAIVSRTNGNGCPFLSGHNVWIGFNDLATTHPELAKEWHPTKNGDLKPTDITAGSEKKVWWHLSYDDPKTGKYFDFEWEATIYGRTGGNGCPYLSNFSRAIWVGFNDLQTIAPNIAKEWHPTKNGDLKPTDVTAGSGLKVWWLLPYDDSNTGKHFDFEWQAAIKHRVNDCGCPYLSGHAVWQGFNDLQTIAPQLVAEWHPTKNGDLKPTDVTACSAKKVWWYLPYDDPKTGKHFDFEWEATIFHRANGCGCPYLFGKLVLQGFNDLATIVSQLAEQWHPTKNGNLKPTDVTVSSGKKVWWCLPYDDPKTGRHFDFEWEATIANRIRGNNCPYLTNQKVWRGFNDIETFCNENNLYYLLNEWDYEKNKNIKPTDITHGYIEEIWWKCPKNHTYKMLAYNRTINHCNCPICAKENRTSFPEQAIYFYLKQKFNDVQNRWVENKVELDIKILSIVTAVEYDGQAWHQDLDRDLKKNKYCNDNNIMLYRIRENDCPHMDDDSFLKVFTYNPNNEKELENIIIQLGKCLNVELDVDINRDRMLIYSQYIDSIKEGSLLEKYPQIAAEWHPTKNGSITPNMVPAGSNKKVWWCLPYDDPKTGKHFDFEWQAQICNRVRGDCCPYLSGKSVWKGFNDLETISPNLALEWHPTKNGNLKPTDVTANSNKKIWWCLPYDDPKTGKHFDFEWQAIICSRMKDIGCPYLSGRFTWSGFNDLQTILPELAKEWHPTKNGDLKPSNVTVNSSKKVWWLLPYDDPKTGKHFDFEWQATIYSRSKGNGCPYLANKNVLKGFNDLQTVNPMLASEWHPTKNGDLKPTHITAGSGEKVWWKCSVCGYEWKSKICNRKKCEKCKKRSE